jgi:hypothetical protein
VSRGLAWRVRTLEAAVGGTDTAWSGHQRGALAAALAALGRTDELEDRLARLRAPRTGRSTEDWTDGDGSLRELFTQLFCERVGIPLLPGDEREAR